MTYHPTKLINIMFNAIEIFTHLTKIDSIILDGRRKPHFIYVVFQTSRPFLGSLKKLNKHDTATKTYSPMRFLSGMKDNP